MQESLGSNLSTIKKYFTNYFLITFTIVNTITHTIPSGLYYFLHLTILSSHSTDAQTEAQALSAQQSKG